MNSFISVLKVKKNSGDLVPFDSNKLRLALLRSGAKKQELDEIEDEVFGEVYEGISTKRIYQIAYKILKKRSQNAAGRYRLKKAIFDLGPSGYPFEKFIGRLFEHQGYKVTVGEIVQGKCVTHEVDVIAENEHEIIMVECKFHRQQGRKSDVKVALYIKSRFDDIYNRIQKEGQYKGKKFRGYIATNTRFTNDAINYGKCAGLSLISWGTAGSAKEHNLQEWVEDTNFHLITALSSATKKVKQIMLENNIVLCRDVINNEKELLKIGVPNNLINKIIKEAKTIIE